ncbi:MAG TPA: alpha/beta hydrolase-fold protein [Vicinamibacterales bacterium]|nr:alpha/beta hydrolase-fold protein [Vicinamibacterales bacterium]
MIHWSSAHPWRRAHNLLVVATILGARALPAPVVFHVGLGQASAAPVSGRLLIFAKLLGPGDKRPVTRVDMDQIDTHATAIAAQEVARLAPGATVDIDADISAFPTPFSQLKPGHYAVQAVLDRDHSYNYTSRGPGDLVSGVVEMDLPGDASQPLTLATIVPESDPLEPLSNVPAAMREVYPAAKSDIHPIEFVSPALSNFWGRPVMMHGWVVTPPDYVAHPGQRFPTVYYTQGFGGSLRSLHDVGVARWNDMQMGKAPSMIWVGIDQSSPSGTSEFVNSVNNGPWGQALTAELIPDLERHYRMDAKPSGRFVTGHSSGGWAALWLQVNYPKLFGGAWPTSPDPSDFHNFLGVDLYAPRANVYRKPDGSPWPLAQDKGQMLVSIEDYTRREVVVGAYGGQLASFEWVFSPRGADGLPVPLFDRTTGAVDSVVISYWRDHYDVAERLRRHWPELKRDLDSKIHLTVGSADSFYLDGAAHLLEATMKELGARTDFRYVEGRGHFDLYAVGDDPRGLYKTIAWEIYALARPGSDCARSSGSLRPKIGGVGTPSKPSVKYNCPR